MLRKVGVPAPESSAKRYPHQMSGGQRQRVVIGIAFACKPKVLIADEPTTALNVTIQAQILGLLAKLQRERGMGLLLITHDLGIVAQMADRVAVMYAGEIVEVAPREAFFRAPQHPYAQKLFAALPSATQRAGPLAQIPGQVPALTQAFAGCRFAERCELAFERCRREAPQLIALQARHEVRCHLSSAPLQNRTDAEVPRNAEKGTGVR